MRTIEISDEVLEYLSMITHSQGEAAWYENHIKLDLHDYDGAIKSIVNQMETWRALANDQLSPNFYFETEIRVIVEEEVL